MSNTTLAYGTVTALTVTGLSTLANGAAVTSATIDNSTAGYFDYKIEVTATTAAGAVVGGYVAVYGLESIDNSDFDTYVTAKRVGSLRVLAAGITSPKAILSLAQAFGGSMPPYTQLYFVSAIGAALTAGAVFIQGIKTATV